MDFPWKMQRMVLPSVLVYKTFLERSKADTIYICSTNLCDGSVVDYAQKMKKIKVSHDFYQDITLQPDILVSGIVTVRFMHSISRNLHWKYLIKQKGFMDLHKETG